MTALCGTVRYGTVQFGDALKKFDRNTVFNRKYSKKRDILHDYSKTKLTAKNYNLIKNIKI